MGEGPAGFTAIKTKEIIYLIKCKAVKLEILNINTSYKAIVPHGS